MNPNCPSTPASRSFKLCHDVIFPGLYPCIGRQLKTPADVTAQLLLSDTTWTGDWSLWFESVGMKGPSIDAGSEFSLYSLALQAAIDGAGCTKVPGFPQRASAILEQFQEKCERFSGWNRVKTKS
ncbi:hypothetical protein [Mesorhizobium sp. 43Arga]